MAEIPLQLKSLSSIVARANELENVEPAVTYWSRYWVVQRSIELQKQGRSQEVEDYLLLILDQLESMKDRFAGTIEIEDRPSGKRKLESFALQVFDNADREEKAKRATRSTSLKFLAAASFLEVCQVFGTPEKDLADRRKYAKVQAMRIQSAIAAGKDPNMSKSATTRDLQEAPPSAAETAELETLTLHTDTITDSSSIPVAPTDERSNGMPVTGSSNTSADPIEQLTPLHEIVKNDVERDNPYFPMAAESLPDQSISSIDDSIPEPTFGNEVSGHKNEVPTQVNLVSNLQPRKESPRTEGVLSATEVDADAIANAQKHAKWAISALNYEDIKTAISELRKSLKYLGTQNL